MDGSIRMNSDVRKSKGDIERVVRVGGNIIISNDKGGRLLWSFYKIIDVLAWEWVSANVQV